MSTTYIQLKDLGFFRDGTVFDRSGGIHVITSQVDVSPTWLIETLCSRCAVDSQTNTILVTFMDSVESHKRPLKKLGVDSAGPNATRSFSLLNLSDIAISSGSKALDTKELVSKIRAKTRQGENVVILENIDVLLATGEVTEPHLSQFVYAVKNMLPNTTVIVNCQVDAPLFEGLGPLSDNQGSFVTRMIMQSSLVLSLRPFTTGRADDVTGVLKVTRGGKQARSPVVENEYLYLVTGDSAKVFYR